MPRAPKRCGRDGCLTTASPGRTYCTLHTAQAQARANTAARGYDAEHERLRRAWAPIVKAGGVQCHATICHRDTRTIAPGERWHLGHTDDRSAWTGPEHVLCNTRNAARSKATVTQRS